MYKTLLNGLYRNHGYSAGDDLIKGYKLLWKCASGEVPKRTSAIKILKVQEEVYQALKDDEIFSIKASEEDVEE